MGEVAWEHGEMSERNGVLAPWTWEVLDSCMHMCVTLGYWPGECSCGLGASYVLVPASGETRIQGSVTEQRAPEPSCWRNLYHTYVPLVDLHPTLQKRGTSWVCWYCLCSCDCSLVCLWSMWLVMYMCIYVYMSCICTLWMYLLGIHLQALYWLDLRTWSDSSLISLGLLIDMIYLLLITLSTETSYIKHSCLMSYDFDQF